MTNIKKLIIAGIAALALIAGSVTAFAASQYKTTAEAVAGLSGREAQSVIDEREQTGKTYGAIANEAGVLDEFKAEMLEMKKDILKARVDAGTMTQEQADAFISRIEENQLTCDGAGIGYGRKDNGLGAGARFGQGNDQGLGKQGRGMGNGMCNGSRGR
ncbi:MAG: DUF2680 domain-containing protein [Clostridiales bacterium]|nr:DUF2680 domain-containing protein [Clostridiales bacterium]